MFCRAISSTPINGHFGKKERKKEKKKALHNTLVKNKTNKQTAKLAILPYPCNKALHPQSMIVKKYPYTPFPKKIPLIQIAVIFTHGKLRLP